MVMADIMPVILPVSGNKVCMEVFIEFAVRRIEIEIAETSVLQSLRLYVDRGDRFELADLADLFFWEDLNPLDQEICTCFSCFCGSQIKFRLLQESFRETSDELGIRG